MAQWKVDGAANLGKLNSHLGNDSYISGVQPSSDDEIVHKALGAEPDKRWVHIVRWYKHISWFPEATRSGWGAPKPLPGAGAGAGTTATTATTAAAHAPAPAAAAAPAAAKADDDFDLFDETDEQKAEREKQAKDKADALKKAKPAVIGRSSIILNVKPWGEETDLTEVEKRVREIAKEGMEWKASSLVPLAFGIRFLQIMCHVVDDLVSVDEDIIAVIEGMEDLVQSVDIHAFNKL